MTASFFLPPLGRAVHAALVQDHPGFEAKRQTALREFFTTGVETSSRYLLPTVQAWLTERPILADRILEQPGHLLATSFAPLLVWAMNEPWGHSIDTACVLEKWLSLATDGQSPPAHISSAAVFASTLVDVLDQVPAPRKAALCVHAYNAVEQAAPVAVQPTAMSSEQEVANTTCVAIALGHLAFAAPTECGRDGIELQTLWQERWEPTWENMTYSQNSRSIQQLLHSELPTPQKLRALSKTGSDFWSAIAIQPHLIRILPDSEYARAQLLPWADGASIREKPAYPAQSPQLARVVTSNQTLLRTYCPDIYAHIEMVASLEDWSSRTTLSEWMRLFEPGLTPETMALPADYAGDFSQGL